MQASEQRGKKAISQVQNSLQSEKRKKKKKGQKKIEIVTMK